MLEKFKRKDVVAELDKHIDEEEAIYVESEPNILDYIVYMMTPYFLYLFLMLIIDFVFIIIYPEKEVVFMHILQIFLFAFNIFYIAFLGYKFVENYIVVINTYYIITNRGIHMTSGGKTIVYTAINYTDINSISMKRNKFSKVGSIFIKTKADKMPTSLFKKIIFRRSGLIGIDDVNSVYVILDQIGKVENPEMLAFDSPEVLKEMDYFKNPKKYSEKIDSFDKDESLLERRNKKN